MGRRIEKTFSQTWNTYGQKAHEKKKGSKSFHKQKDENQSNKVKPSHTTDISTYHKK